MSRVDITYPGGTITRSITALVRQPVSPSSAPPIDIGLVEISTPAELIPGPPGPPGPGVVISDTPPPNPVDGTQWWESDTGILWTWYIDPSGPPGQWVQISGGTGSNTPTGVYVAAFGSVTLGKTATDAQATANTAASDSAIAYAKNNGISQVIYPAGDFVVKKSVVAAYTGSAPALFVDYANGLFLHGQGTRLWLWGTDKTTNISGISFWYCTGNFGLSGDWTIDVLNPALVQGKIAAINSVPTPNTMDITFERAPTFTTVECINRIVGNGIAEFIVNGPAEWAGRTLTPVSGLTYRVNTVGASDGGSSSITVYWAVGDTVVAAHRRYGGFAVSFNQCDGRLVVPETVTINGSFGFGVYGIDGIIDFRGRIVPGYRDGKKQIIACPVDGAHLIGCGRGSRIGGEITGTTDDAINFHGYNVNVHTRVDATTVRVTEPSYGVCRWLVGDEVAAMDATCTIISRHTVTAVTTSDAGITHNLTVTGSLPAGMNNTWLLSNISNSSDWRIKDGFHCSWIRGAMLATSGASWHVGNCSVDRALSVMRTVGGAEIGSYDLGTTGKITATRVNYLLNSTYIAARLISFLPMRRDGVTPAARGSLGRLAIDIDVYDTNSGLVEAAGFDKLSVKGSARNIGVYGGSPAPYPMLTISDTNTLDLTGLSIDGVIGATTTALATTNVGTVRWRNSYGLIPPTTGFTILDVDNTIAWTPTLSFSTPPGDLVVTPVGTAVGRMTHLGDNLVHLYLQVSATMTFTSNGSLLVIRGMPITMKTGTAGGGAGALSQAYGLRYGDDRTDVSLTVVGGQSLGVAANKNLTTVAANIISGNITSGATVTLHGSIIVEV